MDQLTLEVPSHNAIAVAGFLADYPRPPPRDPGADGQRIRESARRIGAASLHQVNAERRCEFAERRP